MSQSPSFYPVHYVVKYQYPTSPKAARYWYK